MSDYAIEATDLVREFKNGPRAVDGIDLGVAPGEIYGFLGPNGAGKSTTVHMLTTLLPPTAGSARVAGFDVVMQGPQVRSSIGAALQEAALDPLLTGREHLRLQMAMHGVTRHDRRRRSDELLERVGLAQAADRAVIEVILSQFGEPHPSPRGLAVHVSEAGLADIVRALDAEGIHVANLQLHSPSLDDVFLEKTGRSLEGAEIEEPESLTV